jgi:AraC family transcriptional regulator, regulatory protein of adaptative response / methylated-DNA-[protein]-cysteine methyltransferase
MLDPRHSSSELTGLAKNSQSLDSNSEKWRAVVSRDSSKDGTFVFAVKSTGIYCRPSCPARHAHIEQILFFNGSDEAERAGFRACLRCRPKGDLPTRSELIQRICGYIDSNLNKKLTLSNLSREAGLSPFHFQRTFKRTLGISPRQYIETRRLERMKRSLRHGETVSNALYEAGFSSRSRVYGKPQPRLGVSPGAFRRGGEGLRIGYTIVDSPIGRLLLGATSKGLCAVCVGASDQAVEASLREDYYAADVYRADDEMREWAEEFSQYFNGHRLPTDLPIDVQATAFQWKVWKQIQAIPYGKTATYTEIAQTVGKPRAVRAVANACANNPVAIIVPCHRVVGKKGDLRGYRWGLKRKETLLSFERQAPD